MKFETETKEAMLLNIIQSQLVLGRFWYILFALNSSLLSAQSYSATFEEDVSTEINSQP